MNELLFVILPLLAGTVLGVIFFGGLWWTVANIAHATRPAVWFLLSFFVRFGIALLGIYYVTDGQWQRLAACMAGFVIARLLVMWLSRVLPVRRPGVSPSALSKESSHAS